MYGFGLDSEFSQHLAAVSARRVRELTPHDYIKAMRLMLTERTSDRRRAHVDPVDLDNRLTDPVFDLLADVTTARLKGRNVELPGLYERITDVLLAVMDERLQDKLVNARQDALRKRRAATCAPYAMPVDHDDPHAHELAADMRVERAEANERMRDYVAEEMVR